MTSLLDKLRGLSLVHCDTLDPEIPSRFGPLGDSTSNPAIDFAELTKLDGNGQPIHQQLIFESIRVANWMYGRQADATPAELAVELMVVALSLRMAPHTSGFVHVQTNPKWANSTEKTIKNSERLISHFKYLAPDFDPKRICIDIICNWYGLQACAELEARGITTMVTAVFGMDQAVSATVLGITLISPYVNEMRVHLQPGYVDPNKEEAMKLCGEIQRHLEIERDLGKLTKVGHMIISSLTTVEEVMQLAGLNAMTIPPHILAELASTPAEEWAGATIGLFKRKKPVNRDDELRAMHFRNTMRLVMPSEEGWRDEMTRSDEGKAEGQLLQTINIFTDMAERLEQMSREANMVLTARANQGL
ncbi:hypothetical protein QBC38DRAFT_196531 [Podospora fimiseda]|uniref:Transaldolase n=1 Tax=Podospora fimiseda TaxID=252190 RepID=A0AAN7GYV6_9PEZI|nr:hypothetical protein QBC38DRAFT_196531 [Podospora fimiseda]